MSRHSIATDARRTAVALTPTGRTLAETARTARTLAELLRRGHTATVLARDPARLTDTRPGVRVEAGSSTDPEALGQMLDGADAVLSALGPSAKEPDLHTRTARLLVQAMPAAGLDWTLVRPPRLLDTPATGRIGHDPHTPDTGPSPAPTSPRSSSTSSTSTSTPAKPPSSGPSDAASAHRQSQPRPTPTEQVGEGPKGTVRNALVAA